MTNLREFLKILSAKVTDELVVTTISREDYHWRTLTEPRDGNLYRIYMSGATSVALGMALSLPHRRVICLDGDGSILMDLSILLAIGHKNPSNLIVIIGDNEAYDVIAGFPTFTADKADLVAIARGAGIPNAWEVREPSEFERVIEEAFQANGASFIDLKIEKEPELPPSKIVLDCIENKYRFIRYIERTENLDILVPGGVSPPTKLKWP